MALNEQNCPGLPSLCLLPGNILAFFNKPLPNLPQIPLLQLFFVACRAKSGANLATHKLDAMLGDVAWLHRICSASTGK